MPRHNCPEENGGTTMPRIILDIRCDGVDDRALLVAFDT